jgi:hypothetical protein
MAAYEQNSRILLLTTWKAHLDAFRSRFEAAGLKPVVFTGAMKAKERGEVGPIRWPSYPTIPRESGGDRSRLRDVIIPERVIGALLNGKLPSGLAVAGSRQSHVGGVVNLWMIKARSRGSRQVKRWPVYCVAATRGGGRTAE